MALDGVLVHLEPLHRITPASQFAENAILNDILHRRAPIGV